MRSFLKENQKNKQQQQQQQQKWFLFQALKYWINSVIDLIWYWVHCHNLRCIQKPVKNLKFLSKYLKPLTVSTKSSISDMSQDSLRRVIRGGDGEEVSPALFRILEKSALIWRKNALIVVISGCNFSFKMKFLRVSRGKPIYFFPAGPFFLVL